MSVFFVLDNGQARENLAKAYILAILCYNENYYQFSLIGRYLLFLLINHHKYCIAEFYFYVEKNNFYFYLQISLKLNFISFYSRHTHFPAFCIGQSQASPYIAVEQQSELSLNHQYIYTYSMSQKNTPLWILRTYWMIFSKSVFEF